MTEMTVVATRTPNAVDRTPASVSVASGEALEDMQAATIQPVVRTMPNVEMGGGPRGDALIPTIRGVFGASVTLLLDGARQNDIQSPGMKSPLYADPYFLKRIEVLRGAASSLYGSGGNGGVMSLSTLSARDLLAEDQKIGGGIRAGYATGDSSFHLNGRVYGGNDKLDALVAVGRHGWDKIDQPGGSHLDPNDGNSTTGLVKLGVNPVRDARIELSHQFYKSENLSTNNPLSGRYRKTTDVVASIPSIQPTHIDQRNTVLKASYGDLAKQTPQAELSVYRSYLEVQMDPYGTNPKYGNAAIANYQRTLTRTDGANLLLSHAIGGHRLAVGGDLFIDKLDSASGTATIAVNPVNPAGERRGSGLFIQDEIAFAEHWKLIPTLRYDQYKATQDGGTQPANEESRLSPKATLAWENRGTLVYASYGEGFRAPAVNELFQRSTFGVFSWFLPNPALKPEVDRTAEIGTKLKYRNLLTAGDSFHLRAALFHSRVSDLISSVNLGNIPGQVTCPVTGTGCQYQYLNIAHGRRVGGEIEAGYSHDLWRYNLAYGRVRVSNPDSHENLFSPPDKLTAQIRRALPGLGISVLWNSTFVAKQDYDSTVLRRRAGYSVHDLYLSWSSVDGKYRVDAGVSNLFDKAYATYQSSNIYTNTYQQGRSLQLAFSAEF